MSILSHIDHSTQRKYTLLQGEAIDHAGAVQVEPLPHFDLDRTIFQTLSGTIPRLFMTAKIAKKARWDTQVQEEIEKKYQEMREAMVLPELDTELLAFMEKECDFNAEHADGSFMEHLLYGYEYCLRFYPQHSARVMLLHSILGTATNTFAMDASKIPKLQEFLTDFEFRQISAFPSFLRLMYEPDFFRSLLDQRHRLERLEGIRFHRVIDNQLMTLSREELWIQLNYHLIHFVDFLPVSNWQTHHSDPLLQICIELSDFLDAIGQRQAKVTFAKPVPVFAKPIGERLSFGSRLSNLVPASMKLKLSTKSIRQFSSRIGHSLDFELIWSS